MATKRKAAPKKAKAVFEVPPKTSVSEEKPVKPQFVTEVVEELPVNEGVDAVSEEDLETIKEDAKEIEDVVSEIQEKKEEEEIRPHEPEEPKAEASEESEDGETEPVPEAKSPEKKQEEEKEVLEEIFTKESSPKVYPDITEYKRMGAAPVFLWAVIIIGVALLTGGTLLVVASGLPKLPTLLAKPTPTPTLAPTPIPTPAAAARSDIKVQVLNGGGTAGSAGKAKAFLEDKGYTVAAVGNTDEYTYKKTEIHVKAGKVAYLELLKKDLSEDYTIGTTSADLSVGASYDARVIIGKE